MATVFKLKKAEIMIVDDQPLVREGLIRIITREKDLNCNCAVDTIVAARDQLTVCKPDLVLMDLLLPDGCGLEFIRQLTQDYPSLPVLVVSQCDEALYAERALKAGARGFLMKNHATSGIPAAIRAILAGQIHVSAKVAALALHQMAGRKSDSHREGPGNLTDRELQIFQLLGAGVNTRDMAAKLHLSVKTIETHRENIKRKLKLSSAAELIRYSANWVERQNVGTNRQPEVYPVERAQPI
ncbi:MAG TPA: response regulator transcription factor [Verrucomicrobiae bacterium]|jgi:DNA-binding NarL/FixJ family response regulator|nr:response regulator transcription factor [Verrucomicrobiae bacterium]